MLTSLGFGDCMNEVLRFAELLPCDSPSAGTSSLEQTSMDGYGFSIMHHQDHMNLDYIRKTFGINDFRNVIKQYFNAFWAEEMTASSSYIHSPSSSALWRSIESLVSTTLSEYNETASAWRVGPAGKGEPMDVRCSVHLAALKQDLLSFDVSFSTFRCSENALDVYEGSTLSPKLWREAVEVLHWMQERSFFKTYVYDALDEPSGQIATQVRALGKKYMQIVLVLSLASWEQFIFLSCTSAIAYLNNVYLMSLQGNICDRLRQYFI